VTLTEAPLVRRHLTGMGGVFACLIIWQSLTDGFGVESLNIGPGGRTGT